MSEIPQLVWRKVGLIVYTRYPAVLIVAALLFTGWNRSSPLDDTDSAYGAYGRHNREYNRHELVSLLNYCGFEVEVFFFADVHDNISARFFPLDALVPLVKFRENDLGQYLFLRSRNSDAAGSKRPAWLYRSYPPRELES